MSPPAPFTAARSPAWSSATSCSRSSSARRPDDGRAFFVDLAAKHVAVARGLGHDGVYLGGHMPAAATGEILDLANSFAPDDWREFAGARLPPPGRVLLLRARPGTGLSSDEVSATYLDSKQRRRTELRVPVSYRFSRRVHDTVFADDAPLSRVGRSMPRSTALRRSCAKRRTRSSRPRECRSSTATTAASCSLPEIAYRVCPESQCAKNQRNGPCGGTRDGLCEVYDTECIWSQAYERLKAYGEEESMLDGPVVVKDNALAGTSAWANALLARDHQARGKIGPSREE